MHEENAGSGCSQQREHLRVMSLVLSNCQTGSTNYSSHAADISSGDSMVVYTRRTMPWFVVYCFAY